MSIIFNGTEVTDVVMDNTTLDAVLYNGVCVFGGVSFIKNNSVFNDLANTIIRSSQYHIDHVKFVTEQPPTSEGSTITVDGHTYTFVTFGVAHNDYFPSPPASSEDNPPYSNPTVISTDDSPYETSVYVYSYSEAISIGYHYCFLVYSQNNSVIVFPTDCTAMFSLANPLSPSEYRLYEKVSFSNRVVTSNVLTMDRMFYRSRVIDGLEHIDVSGARSMRQMFAYSACETLNLSSFKAPNCLDARGLFEGCYGGPLTTIYGRNNTFSNVDVLTDDMFRACEGIVGGNGTTYDADHTDGEYARIDTAETPGYFTAAT